MSKIIFGGACLKIQQSPSPQGDTCLYISPRFNLCLSFRAKNESFNGSFTSKPSQRLERNSVSASFNRGLALVSLTLVIFVLLRLVTLVLLTLVTARESAGLDQRE